MTLTSIEFPPDQHLDYELPVHGASAHFLTRLYTSFGIEPTKNLIHFTYGACDVSRIVDDCIDFPDRPTPSTLDQLMADLESGTIKDMCQLEAARVIAFMSRLDEDRLDFARERYLEAVHIADIRTDTHKVSDYIATIRQEAAVQYAVLNVSEDGAHPDVAQRKQYNRWLKRFIPGAYFVDAAVDIATDRAEGRTKVNPNMLSRLLLLSRAVPLVANTVRTMPIQTVPTLGGLAVSYNIPKLKQIYD